MIRTGRRLVVGILAAWLALSIAVVSEPAYANPVPLETSLAERTNPAVHIVTTQYDARVSLRQIKFSRDGQRLILLAAIRRAQGELKTQRSFIDYVFDRVQRNPTRYLTATGKNRTRTLRSQYVGSSFIATSDGYLVTARHVVTPDKGVRLAFSRAGAATFGNADSRAVLKTFARYDLSTGAMRKVDRSIQGYARAKVKVKLSGPKVAVKLGVASGSGERVAKSVPAEVVYRSQPSLGEDVAVLRVRVDGQLPVIELAENPPLQGSQVFINSFPAAATYIKDFSKAAKLQPTLSKGTVTAVKSTKGGLPLYQTDANASPGSSGGAAFDEQGKIIGILSSGAVDANGSGVGENYLMPLEAVRTALTRSGAKPQPSQTSLLWEQGLNDYHQDYYTKALGEFQQVRDQYPAHAYVGRYIADSQAAINQGKDKTPPPPVAPPQAKSSRLPIMVAAGAVLLVAALVVTALVLRRRSRAARPALATGPAPVPPPPYPYGGQPGVQAPGPGYGPPGVGYGQPVQPMPPGQPTQAAWYPTWYGAPDSYPNPPGSQGTPPTQPGPPNWPPASGGVG